MKTVYRILSGIAVFASFAACDSNKTPEFADSDSFASFSKNNVSVSENAGKVSIPVTVASVNPIATSITYKIADGGSAVAGTDFSLVDPSGVLTFDGKTRTANIEINIVPMAGTFTGDKSFTINLENATGINLGSEKSCVVTILDNDHPLNDVLGAYDATGPDYFAGAPAAWTMTFYKNGDSDKSIIIDGISPTFSGAYPASSDAIVYGNVSGEIGNRTITIAVGQKVKYSGREMQLWWFDGGENVDNSNTLNVVFEPVPGGFTASKDAYGIGFLGNSGVQLVDLLGKGITLVKK